MKKVFFFLVLLFPVLAMTQVSITSFAGISSTKVKYYYWEKGGSYGIYGIEMEGRLKPRKLSLLHLSVVTGLSYLDNGYYHDSGISLPFDIFSSQTSELNTKYLQIPLELKLNWQPFALVEDWRLFVGAGVSNNILIKAHLEEKETEVSSTPDLFAPPQSQYYEDSEDITGLSRKYSLFTRFEIGTIFKRVHFSYRFSFALQDMNAIGLEATWQVPGSRYISANDLNGGRKERYSEFILGYRITK